MTSNALAVSTDDVMDTCGSNMQSLIRESIGEILRQKGFGALEWRRDDALRAISRDEPDPVAYYLKQQQIYYEQCTELIHRMRPQLHREVDEVIEELQGDVAVIDASRQLMSPTKSPRQFQDPAHFAGSQFRAPVAEMENGNPQLRDRARSVTMAAIEQPPAPHAPSTDSAAMAGQSSNAVARTPPPAPPQIKRPRVDAISTTPSKRTKTTAETPLKTGALPATPTSTSKGKKATPAKKPRTTNDDEDEDYENALFEKDFPPLGDLRRTARQKKNPTYEDKLLRDDEFADS